MIEEGQYQTLSIIDIHKGGFTAKIEGKLFKFNCGVLISGKFIAVLDIQTRTAIKIRISVHNSNANQSYECIYLQLFRKCLHLIPQFGQSSKIIQKSIQINPYLAILQKNLGLIFMKTVNIKQGIKSFKKALQITLKDSTIHYLLGMALKQDKQMDMALASFIATVKPDPGYEQAYFQMAKYSENIH